MPTPAADLVLVTPGPSDSIVGVDESTGSARRFPLSGLPLTAAAEARIAAIEEGQAAGMLGFATKALMDADLAHIAGTLALVTNDATAANNGTYRKTGGSGAGAWVAADDRVSGLEEDVANLGGLTGTRAAAGAASALPATPAGYRKVVIDGNAYSMPYYAFIEPVDVFVIVGQSNAEGRGDSGTSPDATDTGLYFDGASFTELADPVGGASTGSMWPAWANEWHALTGRRAVFVESAKGSTRLLDYGMLPGDTWASGGSLRGAAASDAQDVVTALAASNDYQLANLYFVWCQGEGDAENLDGSHTAAMYEQGLEDLATYFKGQVPEMVSMAVVRSGSNVNDATKDAGYLAVREAQEDACDDSTLLTMAYRGTYSFRTLNYHIDGNHWSQAGLNLAGKCGARGLNSPESRDVLATIGAPDAYTDTDYSTTATSKTESHTTDANTKCLIVAASCIRGNSTTTFLTSSITFNGVPMTLVREQADNGTTACRAVSAVYFLDEATYGGSLSGITANIVVTATVACNTINFAAFNSVDDLYIGYANSANMSGDLAAVSLDYYTGDPSLTVAVYGSAAASAAALTHTLSGVTEVLDAGGSNGTRSTQTVIGYAQDAAPYGPRAITATASATCNCGSLVVASFRQRWNGE